MGVESTLAVVGAGGPHVSSKRSCTKRAHLAHERNGIDEQTMFVASYVPPIEKPGRAEDDGPEKLALRLREARDDKRRNLEDYCGGREQQAGVARHLQRGEEVLSRGQLQEPHALLHHRLLQKDHQVFGEDEAREHRAPRHDGCEEHALPQLLEVLPDGHFDVCVG
eukprot:1959638-Pyramimonas_sp.AAC.4